jgi:hypothetical protein
MQVMPIIMISDMVHGVYGAQHSYCTPILHTLYDPPPSCLLSTPQVPSVPGEWYTACGLTPPTDEDAAAAEAAAATAAAAELAYAGSGSLSPTSSSSSSSKRLGSVTRHSNLAAHSGPSHAHGAAAAGCSSCSDHSHPVLGQQQQQQQQVQPPATPEPEQQQQQSGAQEEGSSGGMLYPGESKTWVDVSNHTCARCKVVRMQH